MEVTHLPRRAAAALTVGASAAHSGELLASEACGQQVVGRNRRHEGGEGVFVEHAEGERHGFLCAIFSRFSSLWGRFQRDTRYHRYLEET